MKMDEERPERLFIPMTLDMSYESSSVKLVRPYSIIILLFTGLLVLLGSIAIWLWWYTTVPSKMIVQILVIIVYSIFFKILIQESKLKEIFTKQKKYNITNLAPFWRIFSLDEGMLRYTDGSVGVIILIEHECVTFRPTGFMQRQLRDLIAFLTNKGYMIIDYQMRGPSTEALTSLERLENVSSKNKNLSPEAVLINKLIYQKASTTVKKTSNTVHHYIQIQARGVKLRKDLKDNVAKVMRTLKASPFKYSKQLNKNECLDFISKYFGITLIEFKSLIDLNIGVDEKASVIRIRED